MVTKDKETSLKTTKSALSNALPQIIAVGVKNVLLLGFGMTLGFPTILIPSLSGDKPGEKFFLGQEAISWIGSINLICVPVGCFMSGAITEPIGRKRAMQITNIPFVMAWLMFYFSTEVWQVFVALALTGLSGGLLEAPVLTYVAEITEPHLRGMLSATSSMAVISGVLVEFLLGTFFHWRTVALISCIMPFVSFTLLFFVPETPIWLISKNREEEAKKSLAWLRGWTSIANIEDEYRQLCQHSTRNVNNSTSEGDKSSLPQSPVVLTKIEKLKLFTKKNFIWPYALVSYAFFLSHFCGMAPLQTYAVNIFNAFNSPINKYYATVILGAVELLGCILCVSLVHYVGKRVINLVSLLGAAVCFFSVATYAHLKAVKSLDVVAYGDEPHSWIPVTLLILCTFFVHMGIRLLPWILTGEVYSVETRAFASGLSGAAGYVFNFLANKIFLSLINTLTLSGTLWFFSSMSFIGLVVLFFALPETEGKTLNEISDHFAGRSKLGNHVSRTKQVYGVENKAYNDDEKNDNYESKL